LTKQKGISSAGLLFVVDCEPAAMSL